MTWIDILIILVLVIFIIVGCIKGFVFSIISLFGTTVNFFISMCLCKPMNNFLNSAFNLQEGLINKFASSLSSMSSGFDVKLSTFTSQSELSSHINETIYNSNLSNFSKKILDSSINLTPNTVAGSDLTLNNIISTSFASFLSIIISFVLIFILIYALLWVISFLSKKANEISDIRFTDRLLGTFFGFIRGFIVIVLVFAILSLFNENGLLSSLFNLIDNSTIANWLYEGVNSFMDKYINIKDIAKSVIDSL